MVEVRKFRTEWSMTDEPLWPEMHRGIPRKWSKTRKGWRRWRKSRIVRNRQKRLAAEIAVEVTRAIDAEVQRRLDLGYRFKNRYVHDVGKVIPILVPQER